MKLFKNFKFFTIGDFFIIPTIYSVNNFRVTKNLNIKLLIEFFFLNNTFEFILIFKIRDYETHLHQNIQNDCLFIYFYLK